MASAVLTSPQRCIVVQQLSHVPLFVTPQSATCQASLSFTIFQSLLRLMSTELVMPISHLVLCRPLFLLPSIFASIRVFSNESTFHIRWPKHWGSSFSVSPSNRYSGLISFRIDWFDPKVLAVQGILKGLLQNHNQKVSVLQCSAFFMVQHKDIYYIYSKNEKEGNLPIFFTMRMDLDSIVLSEISQRKTSTV